ncbi:MAG: hydrogenase accessory protein HypB [Chloroflexota bacterium]
MSDEVIPIDEPLLSWNDARAAALRRRFQRAGVFVVNLMSGPGAGKTTLLEVTLTALGGAAQVGVIVGDLATDNDATRLSRTSGLVRQITTGTVCHLEAAMVEQALNGWAVETLDYLFIENVGNLVCPAAFDLGEHVRVVLFAVTEGEDKPEKYPPLVHRADLILLTKYDLAPLLGFDFDRFVQSVRRVHPHAAIIPLSARTGMGMPTWLDWLAQARAVASARPAHG